MTEEIVNLAPPLTAAQVADNNKFQAEMRERYALPAAAQNKDYYSRRLVADTLDILTILQNQFENEPSAQARIALSSKSRLMKVDCCQWMAAVGMFAEAVALCPDENQQKIYQIYLDAEQTDDADWCEHPRYVLGADGKPQPNYYREFDYFSKKRGKMTSMTRCSECEMRNATDVPDDLLELDRRRQAHIDNHKTQKP